MKNKKGFTLVEILLIVVILAIILAISVPKILDIIASVEKKAYKKNVETMINTAKLQYETGESTGGIVKVPEGGIIYEFENGEYISSDELNIKGDKPYSGSITFTENKKIVVNNLVSKNKKWCAIKEEEEKEIRIGKSTDPEFACIVDPDKPIEDIEVCKLAEGTETIDGETKKVYYIDSVCDMYEFSYRVNAGENFSGNIIKLRNDLDMSNIESISDKLKSKYNTTEFSPIGSETKPFSGTFDGGAKIISNLTINKPNQDNVGLFGYAKGINSTNRANIYGVRINGATVNGRQKVGGLVGYIGSYITIKEIELDNIKIQGSSSSVGGLTGYLVNDTASIKVNNILIKKGTLYGSDYVGYLSGKNAFNIYNSMVEDMDMSYGCSSSCDVYLTYKSNNTYSSTNSTYKNNVAGESYNVKGIDDINFYEAAGLDTWIGGDNDSTGYYFDYDENNKIILKNVKQSPIKFRLKKDAEGNYLIKSEQDWKQASIKPNNKYKLETDLDFSSNKYYMLGSSQTSNQFSGTLNGNDKLISNVEINGNKVDYLGMIGYVNCGTIYGLNVKNIEINGYDNVGMFGYAKGTNATDRANIYAVRMVNEINSEGNPKVSITGNASVGGLVGYTDSYITIKEIELDNIKIHGSSSSVGGLIGFLKKDTDSIKVNNILLKKGTLYGHDFVGYLSGRNAFNIYNSMVEDMDMSYGCSSYCDVYTTYKSNNTYSSTNSTYKNNVAGESYNVKGIDDINFYEAAGLDTWIGGDNDSTGYYFDYDENNKIILKNVKQLPIKFRLKKDAEGNYLIKSEQDWKQASIKPNNKYKLETDLDFSSNKYYMLGSSYNTFSGTLNGNDKLISNVEINGNKVDYLGMIGYVNCGTIYGLNVKNIEINGYDNVGMFGYAKGTNATNRANIYALRMVNEIDSEGNPKVSITGNASVGGLVGYTDSYITIKEIELDNIKIHGNSSSVGGLIGFLKKDTDSIKVNNILLKKGTLYGSDYVGYLSGRNPGNIYRSMVEDMDISYGCTGSCDVHTTYKSSNTYSSINSTYKNNVAGESYNIKGIDDINFYEAAGLDTWIGGDNDSTGYYFDYDENNKIILKNVKQLPIKFRLKKDAEGNYLIKSEQDWKQASIKPNNKYKLETDLDFSSNKYYMLGSSYNTFSGTLNGNDKLISNVEINGNKVDYLGMIGYVNCGTIYGLNVKNIEINGYDNVGMFGYAKGTNATNRANIYAVRMVNEINSEGNPKVSITGNASVGGLVGYTDSYITIKEIELDNIKIHGSSSSVGGLIGFLKKDTDSIKVNNILLKKGTLYGSDYVGYLSGRNPGNIYRSMVEDMDISYGCSSSCDVYTTYKSSNTYSSTNSTYKNNVAGESYNVKGIDDINFYEAAGLDTWIGSDNDSSGYYFDYDSNNKIILKSVKQNPITFNLSKDSDDNYLIKSYKDFKEASSKPNNKYKLETDLDFSSNKYYMLGSSYNTFSGTLNGNDKLISNVEINGNKVDYLGMIGYVNCGTIYGLNVKNIEINGYDNVGMFGYAKGTNATNRANIYAVRMVNEINSEGNPKVSITGNASVGGLVGYTGPYITIKEIELDNIKIHGNSSSVGGLIGFLTNDKDSIKVNNILLKKGTLYGSDYVGYLSGRNPGNIYNSIVEDMDISYGCSSSCDVYITYTSSNTYSSINSTYKGTVASESFAASLVDNLEHYAGVLETLYSGDSNNTGYFFDKTNDGKIHLVKAYSLTFTSPPSDDEEDTNTEGGGTDADTCYITISCSGSGNYRNCYISYYENGVSEAPYLNTMTLDLTRGSSCAAYSPNNSSGGFNFYVKKKSTSSCSVTFRARSNKDCITTTYKTISF